MAKKIKRTYKVELTFARASAISDKQIRELLLDVLVDSLGGTCVQQAGNSLAGISEIKVTK
jgi:hypothetical protein